MTKLTDKEKIDLMVEGKETKIFAARRLAQWFTVDISIKIFGFTVFEWHFPPESNENEDKVRNQ